MQFRLPTCQTPALWFLRGRDVAKALPTPVHAMHNAVGARIIQRRQSLEVERVLLLSNQSTSKLHHHWGLHAPTLLHEPTALHAWEYGGLWMSPLPTPAGGSPPTVRHNFRCFHIHIQIKTPFLLPSFERRLKIQNRRTRTSETTTERGLTARSRG